MSMRMRRRRLRRRGGRGSVFVLEKERKGGKKEAAVEHQFCRWKMGKCIAIVQNKVVGVLCCHGPKPKKQRKTTETKSTLSHVFLLLLIQIEIPALAHLVYHVSKGPGMHEIVRKWLCKMRKRSHGPVITSRLPGGQWTTRYYPLRDLECWSLALYDNQMSRMHAISTSPTYQ